MEPVVAPDPLKTIVQLLIAGVIVHACARAGESAWRYYEFKDAVAQEARFGNAKTTSELHRQVLQLAEEHGVALESEDVAVERRGEQTFVSASYIESVPLVPAIYTRDQRYAFEVSVRGLRPLTVDDK